MASSIHSAKHALRKTLKEKLNLLTDTEKVGQSKIVTEKLISSVQYKNSQRVSLFLSMHDEIRTEKILEDLLATKKACFIPQYSKTGMKMVRLNSWEDYQSLPETAWKIKQPAIDDAREDAFDSGGLDLILMPGLGFTKEGFRLGRGKGYYDSYLRLCHEKGHKPLTIALAFSEQILDSIPMTDSDIPVDIVLFPEQS